MKPRWRSESKENLHHTSNACDHVFGVAQGLFWLIEFMHQYEWGSLCGTGELFVVDSSGMLYVCVETQSLVYV